MSNKRKAKASEVAGIDDLLKRSRTARSKGDFKELANLHNQLGNQHRLLGNYDEALEHHKEEVNVCKAYNKKDRMGLGIGYRNMGEVLTEMKEETKAIQYIREYLKIAKEVGNFVEEQRAYITLGRAYLSMADKDSSNENEETDDSFIRAALDKAESTFRTAYMLLNEDQLKSQISDEKELMLMKCNNCQNLGLTLELKEKLDDASAWIRKATDIGSKYLFHENLAPCYSILCGIYLKTGKPKDALEAAKKASKAAKVLGNQGLEIESKLLEAKALCQMDEIENAKKILKKGRAKIKKKEALKCYLNEVDPLLIAAVRICRTQDNIFVTDGEDQAKLLKLHEILADNYTTIMNYQAAINHYKLCCEFAEISGITENKVSRLYFSIAESYSDLKDYNNAYKYYVKELALNKGNPVEEFKTQTNITVILEKLNKSHEEVINAHITAVEIAKVTQNLNRVVTALSNYGVYLKSIGRSDESQKHLDMAKKITQENNLQDVEDLEPDSQDLLETESDVDLDNLSDEDDSDDEMDDEAGSRRRKRFSMRVNEAGESQLHIAAKKGDLKAVRRLIRQGHPVTIRDNAGWTSLHEACNFGHAEVVEELLKHGAEVNDAGGALAEKVTPLHDAACNCHSDVIKVLLKYGANVLARDVEGKYPIDSLMGWKGSEAALNCDEQELALFEEVKKMLKQLMAKAGKAYGKEDERKAKKRVSKRSCSPKLSMLVSKTQDVGCPIPVIISTDSFDLDHEGDGRKLYESTMKQVRRKDVDSKCRTRAMSPGPRGALIPAELDVHEDWLLPDDTIGGNSMAQSNANVSKSKRKRDDINDSLNRSTRRKTGRCKDGNKSSNSFQCDLELMSVHSNEPSSASSNESSNGDCSPMLNQENDELYPRMDEELDLPLSSYDFLPSQRPMDSAVEIGETRDIKVVNDDDDRSEPSSSPIQSIRNKNLYVPCEGLSDDDEIQILPSISRSVRRRQKLSDVASNFKNSGRNTRNTKHERRTTQSRLPFKTINKTSRRYDFIDDNSSSPEKVTSISLQRTDSSATLSKSYNSTNTASNKEVLRLKIKILDQVLLVPVDEHHKKESIDWLANECSTRYLRAYGVKPILTLQTKDGATMTGTDTIDLVLETNERELIGNVSGFDLPPLIERYCSACTEARFPLDSDVKSSLNLCQSSNVLDLTNISLRGKASNLLMTALQRQTSLCILILSGCSLFDNGLFELCKVLHTLPGLTELNISSNGITKNGFSALTKTFVKTPQPDSLSTFYNAPTGLSSFIFSHNPLGNSIGNCLAAVINALTALKRLEMADCCFTEKLFLWSKNELTKALSNSRLEDMDVSYNNWRDIGLEKLLQCLPARKLRTLNCSATCVPNHSNDGTTEDTIANALSVFLSQNEDCCNLKSLQLNDCYLNDRSMERLTENFDRLVRLENVELACNSKLTVNSLLRILRRCTENGIPLSRLDMGFIPNLWDVPNLNQDLFLSTIDKKMSSCARLMYLRLPCQDAEEVDSGDGHKNLSKLETKVVNTLYDYTGDSNFQYEKQGNVIIYHFDR